MNTQPNTREIRMKYTRKARRLVKDPSDVERARKIARHLKGSEWLEQIHTQADVENSMHLLEDETFEKWVNLGTSIAARLGHNRGTDPDTTESDHINEVADETASRWVAYEWARMNADDPNEYELEQATIAAKDMHAAEYTDVNAARADLEVTFEAADNIAAEHYIRLGYKWIEHMVTPADPDAWQDAETFAETLIEQALKALKAPKADPILDEVRRVAAQQNR